MSNPHTLTAVRILKKVLQGQPLEAALIGDCSQANRARVTAWVYEACRHYFSLSSLLAKKSRIPLEKLDLEVFATLLIGSLQLTKTDRKTHAIVFDCVEVVKRLQKRSATGFVNAVLRGIARSPQDDAPGTHSDMPVWLTSKINSSFNQKDANAILQGLQSRMPQTLRINDRKIDSLTFQQALNEAGIEFTELGSANAIRIDHPQPTHALPGYLEGWFSVQDASSQLPVLSLDLQSDQRVLDACAAPGIKSFQILELDVELMALDINEGRTHWTQSESKRLGVPLSIKNADATSLDWWDGIRFDRILLDAPCSATGTIGRHPDVKIHRQPEQLAQLQSRQLALLLNLWQTLESDGILVYCTCSILPEENDSVLKEFLHTENDARVECVQLPELAKRHMFSQQYGHLIVPHADWGDGFYIAKLRKVAIS